MKFIFCLLFFFCTIIARAQINLDEIRSNYTIALFEKSICIKMIKVLSTQKSQAIYLGYLGGFQTIMAKHYSNPFSKLKTFNQGKANIESAILKDNKDVELKYIRYSVQKNAPRILGYFDNLEMDRKCLEENKCEIKSNIVVYNINQLLK